MRLHLDPGSPLPIAAQLAAGIRAQVADGELAPGDTLPPARDLAAALGVNLHTVLRGYHELRDEGLVELRRGRGARIRPDASVSSAAFTQAIRLAASAARRLGLDPDDAAEALRAAMR
ncbi:MAG: GntR family transcriptional regulator [Acidimicrobiales bacterium]